MRILIALLLIACTNQVSPELKKAWKEINSETPIFTVYDELLQEKTLVEARLDTLTKLGGGLSSELIEQEKSELQELDEAIALEETRILEVQGHILKAPLSQLDYLANK